MSAPRLRMTADVQLWHNPRVIDLMPIKRSAEAPLGRSMSRASIAVDPAGSGGVVPSDRGVSKDGNRTVSQIHCQIRL